MLSVTGLVKRFGESTVLGGVDLSVNKGDVVAVIGPSGSGKTTMLRCMNFLERADSGTLEFDGESFELASIQKRDVLRLRKKTAFVFQSYNLFLNKTAIQNVTEGLTVVRGISKAEATARAEEALRRVGMLDFAGQFPVRLSGGQQQRVAIARAIATEPELIYFDEPTSALDPELIGEVLAVMRDLAVGGMTMLVVTHEINFAKNVSTRTVFMEGGEIKRAAATEEFFADPGERVSAFLKTVHNT